MYLYLLIMPIISAFIVGVFGRLLGHKGCILISIFFMLLTLILSLLIFYEVVIIQSIVIVELYNWFLLDITVINFNLLFDGLVGSMNVIVCTISFFVHLYSVSYMSHDPYLSRFLSFLSFFTFFMLVLVTADNFIQLFIGWEGVGLSPFLLINFWHTRIAANKAAIKAMVMNRIADAFFIIAILILIVKLKTVDYLICFEIIPYIISEYIIICTIKFKIISLIAFFLLIGAFGKSAQIGFHTWLADAMEGPTPVSALLHAATMVTAGVFLILRCSIIFEYSGIVLNLLLIIGSITAIYAGICALVQYDIKKIIAYSTCSQLGYMLFTCGLSNYNLAFAHLSLHAFFKALLFLCAGAVIHFCCDEQDMRHLHKLYHYLPYIYMCMLIGSFSIMGVPFLTGFYSKDLIIEFAYTRFIVEGYFVYFAGLCSAILTTVYSMRLFHRLFRAPYGIIYLSMSHRQHLLFLNKTIIDAPLPMYISLYILTILSIIIGYIASEILMGLGTITIVHHIILQNTNYIAIEFIPPLIKNMPLLLIIIFIFLASEFQQYIYVIQDLHFLGIHWWFRFSKTRWILKWIFYFTDSILYKHMAYFSEPTLKILIIYKKNFYIILNNMKAFSYHAAFFNTVYNYIFIMLSKNFYIIFVKALDRGFFEYYGPYGIYLFFYKLHYYYKNWWYVLLYITVYTMFLSINLFLCIMLFNMVNNGINILDYFSGLWIIAIYLMWLLNRNIDY